MELINWTLPNVEDGVVVGEAESELLTHRGQRNVKPSVPYDHRTLQDLGSTKGGCFSVESSTFLYTPVERRTYYGTVR